MRKIAATMIRDDNCPRCGSRHFEVATDYLWAGKYMTQVLCSDCGLRETFEEHVDA